MSGNKYTAIVKQDGDWWIGWIDEVPGTNCQESTREELITCLRLVLSEILEYNRQESLEAAGENYQEELIAL